MPPCKLRVISLVEHKYDRRADSRQAGENRQLYVRTHAGGSFVEEMPYGENRSEKRHPTRGTGVCFIARLMIEQDQNSRH